MTANMKLLGWKRRIGAPPLRGLQGRSATNQNGQAAKDKMSCGLDAAKTFLASGSGRSLFRLTSPSIGLPNRRLERSRKTGQNRRIRGLFMNANAKRRRSRFAGTG